MLARIEIQGLILCWGHSQSSGIATQYSYSGVYCNKSSRGGGIKLAEPGVSRRSKFGRSNAYHVDLKLCSFGGMKRFAKKR